MEQNTQLAYRSRLEGGVWWGKQGALPTARNKSVHEDAKTGNGHGPISRKWSASVNHPNVKPSKTDGRYRALSVSGRKATVARISFFHDTFWEISFSNARIEAGADASTMDNLD